MAFQNGERYRRPGGRRAAPVLLRQADGEGPLTGYSNRRMWIGELAERCGLSRDAIRYYERVGVLPRPRRSTGGFRLYDEAASRGCSS